MQSTDMSLRSDVGALPFAFDLHFLGAYIVLSNSSVARLVRPGRALKRRSTSTAIYGILPVASVSLIRLFSVAPRDQARADYRRSMTLVFTLSLDGVLYRLVALFGVEVEESASLYLSSSVAFVSVGTGRYDRRSRFLGLEACQGSIPQLLQGAPPSVAFLYPCLLFVSREQDASFIYCHLSLTSSNSWLRTQVSYDSAVSIISDARP